MEKCQTLISSLIDEARAFIVPFLDDAKLLGNEAKSLKDEIETLLLIKKLMGKKCPYI